MSSAQAELVLLFRPERTLDHEKWPSVYFRRIPWSLGWMPFPCAQGWLDAREPHHVRHSVTSSESTAPQGAPTSPTATKFQQALIDPEHIHSFKSIKHPITHRIIHSFHQLIPRLHPEVVSWNYDDNRGRRTINAGGTLKPSRSDGNDTCPTERRNRRNVGRKLGSCGSCVLLAVLRREVK